MRETVYLCKNNYLPEFSIQVSESSSVANEKEKGEGEEEDIWEGRRRK